MRVKRKEGYTEKIGMQVRKEKRSGMVREEEERHRSGGRENDGKCRYI